ncbi:alpha-galactosidase [Glaciecola sp. MH2013]|uniref:alpha-galactosidase n=1 Tax=Glaciecola sp. MH2013 TaxID=2785524 RepID=UPI00189CB427|nr:alpha-galactosidase [Glaciecola sp. MH2013]MBF7074223.1 alpha-galactosidase [Glaciecola sp. MH2013]
MTPSKAQNLPSSVQLNSRHASVIINCQNKTPAIAYFGKKLASSSSFDMIQLLQTRQEAKCAVVVEAPISLSPCMGEGFTGGPGVELSNNKDAWSFGVTLHKVTQNNEHEVIFESIDEHRQITLKHHLKLDEQSNVLSASTQIINHADEKLNIDYCAAPTIPMPDHITKLMSFEGRWSNEFHRNTIDLFLGAVLRENRKGKTSHDNFPGAVLHEATANEAQGECYGFHLGFSGNHRTRVELLPEQRTYIQMGELLMPSELSLEQGESYQSPTLYCSFSNQGFSRLSNNFHSFVRSNILSPQQQAKPRPVHYNTWEGIYFDHDVDTLKNLADRVAKLGVERFVLDDGWFKGRRGDYAGLGDWFVDETIYPDGLSPIIDHVTGLGMEFGIWFEPEMVNPDSDLYRAHPEWALQTEGNEQLAFRNQLVLDLTRQEVIDYLFKCIDDILKLYPSISYIKWDMNRDINHAGDAKGKPAVSKQTQALYKLIDDLKAANPGVEIESCSSGGARIDYGVLAHTDRVWTSDSNDALDRLSIQRGCSFFFPSEVMGAHVGPRDCHITGRHISIEMRSGVSFFGHFGLEMDPRELSEHEVDALQQVIALHKKHRELIHSGDLVRLDTDGNSIDFGIITKDKSHALYAYNSITETKRTMPKKYRFTGLDEQKAYRFNLIWPTHLKEYSESILSKIEGEVISGELLVNMGMQLPITFPQTTLIFELSEA